MDMTDEVARMQGLRKVALKVRANAEVLKDPDERRDSIVSRSALLSWRVARICSGRLRAHPYEAYQRGPTLRDTLNDGLTAIAGGLLARRRGRRHNRLLQQLHALAHQLDNVRALTLTPDLSDALGRAQGEMRQLLSELALRARLEKGVQPDGTAAPGDLQVAGRDAGSPYLAL
jgi:hypothetical protein